jgi:hypothetical protein
MMNEPHPGYINVQSLHSFNYNTDLHLGPIREPNLFEAVYSRPHENVVVSSLRNPIIYVGCRPSDESG